MSKSKEIIRIFKSNYENYTGLEYYILWSMMMKLAKELNDIPIEVIEKRMIIFFTKSWYADSVDRLTFPAFIKNFGALVDPDDVLLKNYNKQRALKQNKPELVGVMIKRTERCPKCEQPQIDGRCYHCD